MASSGMLGRVALVKTDVSEEPSASFIRVTRIGELGTTLAVTSNRRTLQQRESVARPQRVWVVKTRVNKNKLFITFIFRALAKFIIGH
jgi:hypothetical protein